MAWDDGHFRGFGFTKMEINIEIRSPIACTISVNGPCHPPMEARLKFEINFFLNIKFLNRYEQKEN